MAIFDLKIEFLMKTYVYRHLGISGILKFDENLKKICFRTRKTSKILVFPMFLLVILVPELFRKLRETPGNNFHLVSSSSEPGCPSSVQKYHPRSGLRSAFRFVLFSMVLGMV